LELTIIEYEEVVASATTTILKVSNQDVTIIVGENASTVIFIIGIDFTVVLAMEAC
jgi:hypothetical protein